MVEVCGRLIEADQILVSGIRSCCGIEDGLCLGRRRVAPIYQNGPVLSPVPIAVLIMPQTVPGVVPEGHCLVPLT